MIPVPGGRTVVRAVVAAGIVGAFVVVLAVSVGAAWGGDASTAGGVSSFAGTRIHVVTPFLPAGTLSPSLRLQEVSGSCQPDADVRNSISVMNTFTCMLPGNETTRRPIVEHAAYACRSSCQVDPCWRVPDKRPLRMVCIGNPDPSSSFEGFQGELIRVSNRPALKPASERATANPLDAQPWMFRLANDETCSAVFPDGAFPPRKPPILSYGCSQGNSLLFPAGPINRSKPRWTIKAAPTATAANEDDYRLTVQITEAWFIGAGSQ